MFMIMLTKAQDTVGLAKDLKLWRATTHRNPALILGPHLLKYDSVGDPKWSEERPEGDSDDGDTVYKYDGVRVECLCEFRHEHEADLGCVGDPNDDDEDVEG